MYELLVMAMKPYLIKLWHCFWAKLVEKCGNLIFCSKIWLIFSGPKCQVCLYWRVFAQKCGNSFLIKNFGWFFRVQNVRYFCTDGFFHRIIFPIQLLSRLVCQMYSVCNWLIKQGCMCHYWFRGNREYYIRVVRNIGYVDM